jgi:hypothetical protein
MDGKWVSGVQGSGIIGGKTNDSNKKNRFSALNIFSIIKRYKTKIK